MLLDQAIQTVAGAAARPQFHRAALERAGLTSDRFSHHPARKVDPALYGVLLALHGRGMPSPNSLALRLGLHSSTVSHHLARLEDRGLIERSRYWADGRLLAPVMTQAGMDAFVALHIARLSLLDELTGKWSRDDAQRLGTLMSRLGGELRVLNWERQRRDDDRRYDRRRERRAAESSAASGRSQPEAPACWGAGW